MLKSVVDSVLALASFEAMVCLSDRYFAGSSGADFDLELCILVQRIEKSLSENILNTRLFSETHQEHIAEAKLVSC